MFVLTVWFGWVSWVCCFAGSGCRLVVCVAFSVSVVFDLLVACLGCGVFVWLVVWVCG